MTAARIKTAELAGAMEFGQIVACMGFDAFRILQGMKPRNYTAQQIADALLAMASRFGDEVEAIEGGR